nr:class F sortase [Micrococcus sp. KRD026]
MPSSDAAPGGPGRCTRGENPDEHHRPTRPVGGPVAAVPEPRVPRAARGAGGRRRADQRCPHPQRHGVREPVLCGNHAGGGGSHRDPGTRRRTHAVRGADPHRGAAAAHLSGPAAPWDEITATPVHVDVHQDGEQIVGAGIDLTQLDEGGDLDPEPQTVGWYGPPQWGTTPGERSPYAGVLAGHVVYYGVRDVFWNLGDVRAGAVVVVTYDDGTQAAFEADADAVSVEKEALTQDPAHRWAWEPGGDDAKVTLITCDLVPGTGMAGNAFNNWVVQATRVA